MKKTRILLSRELKLNWSNSLVLTLVSFACMGFLCLATSQETFDSYSYALPIAFAKACAAILIGLNMSINMICKDYAIIRRELRMGISASSLIFAKTFLLILMCLVMSILLILPYLIGAFGISDQNTLYLFLAVFFTMFTSSQLGLLISAFSKDSPQRAALSIPFIMLFQILFSGFVFEQVRINIDITTISNYAIRAIGSGMRFDNENFIWDTPPFAFESSLIHAVENLGILVLFSSVAVILSIFILYRIDKLGLDNENT